jgi:protein involved in plasmid replication-relaxation
MWSMSVLQMTRTIPHTPRRFEMTERDIDMLAFLARVRFATADQIIRFTGGSEKNVGNRIRLLYWHGYLSRVDDQRALVKLFNVLGNTAPVYGLGRDGRSLLHNRGIVPTKHRARSPLIPHTVAATNFTLACALASRAPGAPQFLDHAAVVANFPDTRKSLDRPSRFSVPFEENFKIISLNVDPDCMMALLFVDNHRHNFCIEIDLASETIAKRRNGKIVFAKSTFARKIAGYHFGARDGRHRQQWGWSGFRVLTITTSEARIRSMLNAQAEITSGTERFLYTTPERIKERGAFAPIWISPDRDDISIIDRT